jgi:hypothetical protein
MSRLDGDGIARGRVQDPQRRFLPDQLLTVRTLRQRTDYAIHAAACLCGGLLPDLLREAGGWEPGLWTYAVSAVVLYTRTAADRLGQTVPEIAVEIADRLGLELSAHLSLIVRPPAAHLRKA